MWLFISHRVQQGGVADNLPKKATEQFQLCQFLLASSVVSLKKY
jgi:hypothetical protein